MTTSAREVGRDLGDAVGAGGVVGAGHDRAPAELADRVEDALVVGRDDHVGGALRLAGVLVDVLDEVLAGFAQERLAGQPRRRVPGRDDDGDAHGRPPCRNERGM